MNILKNVVNRIAESDKKTELKSEKVELASIKELQDAIKKYTDLKKQNQDALKTLKKAKAEIEKIQDLVDDANSKKSAAINEDRKSAKLLKVLGDFQKAAKELGLNAKDVPDYSKAVKLFEENAVLNGELEDFILPKI